MLICVPTPLTRQPRARPRAAARLRARRSPRCCRPASSSCSSRPPTPARRASASRRCSRSPACAAGRDFHLAFSPERVDPGRTDFTLRNTPKVVGGLTEACGDRAEALYGLVCDELVRVSTPEAAELTKLLENIFRSVNIALVNELAMLTDRMGIDIWEVVDAAATKPYGFMRFEPGPGHGRALPAGRPVLPELARARVRHVDRVHRARRQGQPADALPLRREGPARAQRRAACRSKARAIAVLGVSYKPGVGDIRESPALKIIALLRELGAEVVYHDPHVASAGRRSGSPAARSTRRVDGRRPGADRDRAPGRRPRRDRAARAAASSTCAASRAPRRARRRRASIAACEPC